MNSRRNFIRVLTLPLLLFSASLPAATLTVDTTSDLNLSVCAAVANDCSPRGAIYKANTSAETDLVALNIPMSDPNCVAATGVCTIAPLSAGKSVQHKFTRCGRNSTGECAPHYIDD